jgi:hypothetical protein
MRNVTKWLCFLVGTLITGQGAHALKCRGTPAQVERCVERADARARVQGEWLGRTEESRRLCWEAQQQRKHDVRIDDAEGKRKVRLIPIP